VALSINGLGLALSALGEASDAEVLLRRAIGMRKKALGASHPSVAGSIINLGTIFHNHGQFAEAAELYEEAYTILREALGEDHPDLATVLNNLSMVSLQSGDSESALRYARAASAIFTARAKNVPTADVGTYGDARRELLDKGFMSAGLFYLLGLYRSNRTHLAVVWKRNLLKPHNGLTRAASTAQSHKWLDVRLRAKACSPARFEIGKT
jgi:tetratricopeptide (TPR) repeat protein